MRIAVDTGGTFTDFVVEDGGTVKLFKLPSTPRDPAEAVLRGLAGLAGFELRHGTTVATNAILEGKMARTGMVVDEGFRDLLSLGRQSRPKLYDWEPRKPKLPVRDEDIRTVRGRLLPDGSVLEPYHVEELGLDACEAIAVCLLYSYVNPEAEELVGSHLPGKFLSLSHVVSPEMREYERACATVLNAAVGPVIEKYFRRLQQSPAVRILIMSSMGGLVSLEDAVGLPIRTVVSGPAGGVAATAALGKRLGRANTIAFDMGGTSTDVTVIQGGVAAMTPCEEIAGLPVRLRRIAVHTVGCGGGSIAYVDGAGALRVGPESAGADPGPALYGGDRPTVTDANFILGRLPIARLARQDGLDEANCLGAMRELAERLGTTPLEAAEAIVGIADAQMAAAVRKVTAERGLTPADFSLVAFGGAGGLHACAVAELLEINEVLCPAGAGVFSAIGLLAAPEAWEESLGVLGTDREWEGTFSQLEDAAFRRVPQATRTERIADMRYEGQGHEISVPAEGTRREVEASFERRHFEVFGTKFEGRRVQWVAARVRVEAEGGACPPQAGVRERDSAGRETLLRGSGPMTIADADCTIYVGSGWDAEKLADGTIRLTR